MVLTHDLRRVTVKLNSSLWFWLRILEGNSHAVSQGCRHLKACLGLEEPPGWLTLMAAHSHAMLGSLSYGPVHWAAGVPPTLWMTPESKQGNMCLLCPNLENNTHFSALLSLMVQPMLKAWELSFPSLREKFQNTHGYILKPPQLASLCLFKLDLFCILLSWLFGSGNGGGAYMIWEMFRVAMES